MASDAGRVIPLPKGAWNALTTYETLDIVSYGNQTWMAKLSSIGITPTEGQYWTVYGSTAAMASTTAMGIVKIPTDGTITIDSDGTIHSAGGSASSISTTDPSKSVQDVLDDLDADKADSATTLAGYGITDAKIESGIITLGNNTLKPVSTVDTALSDTSINPVQNKVINSALDTLSNEKANTTDVYGTDDEYNSVASYVVGDMCIYNGKLYKCIKACSGVVPTNESYWSFVSLSNVMEKFDYSTEEKVIGTWIDGKPLYRKVVFLSSYQTLKTSVDIGLSSICTIKKSSILALRNDGFTHMENYYYSASDFISIDTFQRSDINDGKPYIYSNGSSDFYPLTDLKIIIEYTKTTD